MINKKQVNHIAKLARIKLDKKELNKFQGELSSILDYFELLKEVDVSEISPTFHSAEHFFKKKLGVTREDKTEPRAAEVVNKLVEAAPEKKRGYIKVKSVF